jgi:hypothetical protein
MASSPAEHNGLRGTSPFSTLRYQLTSRPCTGSCVRFQHWHQRTCSGTSHDEPFLISSIGHECCLPWLFTPLWIRIFRICYRGHICNANGWVLIRILLRLCDGSPGSPTQVAVIIGELIGHFANDAIMRVTAKRNRGVFEAESRLWYGHLAYLTRFC